MAKSERKFHKETTVITPGADIKNKKSKAGKNKERTTAFGDDK